MSAFPARFVRLTLVLLLCAPAWSAQSQTIRLSLDSLPLAEALDLFKSQSGVDLVYADRLLEGRTSRCVYDGVQAREALDCLLLGTGLAAHQVGPKQFVLVGLPMDSTRRPREGLAGFILDRQSGASLPGAHVWLSGERRGAISNRSGYFVFTDLPAGPQRLRVTFVGFATVDTLLITSARPAVIRLDPSTLLSEAALVESDRIHPTGQTQPAGLVGLPVAKLEQLPAALGGRDLFEVLGWMPGVRRSGEITGGLTVRGSGPEQNLYLLDGAPIYHPWHAFSLISTFQTETFRDIRLYRGAFPAEYGGRLSAVLDAQLSDGRRNEPTAVMALNPLSARFVIESPIGPTSSFMLSGRRSYIDKLIGRRHPVSDDAGRRDTLRTGYYFYDWSGKVVLRPDQDSRFSASWYEGADNLDLRLPFDLSLDLSSWLKPSDLLFEIDQVWSNRVVTLNYERLLAQKWYLSVTGYETRYTAREGAFIEPGGNAAVRSDYAVSLRDIGLRADVDFYRSQAHSFRGGMVAVNREFESGLHARVRLAAGAEDLVRSRESQEAFEGAAYLQDTWRPHPQIHLVGGGRLSYFGGGNYLRFSPRLSLQVTPHPSWIVLRASATRTYQYLHRLRDRNSFLYDLVSSRWIPSGETVRPAAGFQVAGDAELKPFEGIALRLGVYRRTARGILFPIDLYQSKDGLTGPGVEVGTLLAEYQTGRERASGLEAELDWERGRWLGMVALTVARSESRAQNEETFRPARFDAPAAFDTFARRRGTRWSVGMSLRVRSGYPVTTPTSRYTVEDPISGTPVDYLHRPEINNGRLPAYVRLDADISRSFTFLDAAWQARLLVYNVASTRNVINRFFQPDADGLDVRSLRGLPILPLFELEMRL